MSSTVLMVEDSEEDALLFRRLLASSGVTNPVKVVTDGDEAVRYLAGQHPFADRQRNPFPGVVILDLRLPGTDGFAILKWIRGQPDLQTLRVFVVSGMDDLITIRRAYELGAISFLTKPCQPADVEKLVQGFPQYWTRRPTGA